VRFLVSRSSFNRLFLRKCHVGICNSSLWHKRTAIASWKLRSERCARQTGPPRLSIATEHTRLSVAMGPYPRNLFYTTNYTSNQASGSTRSLPWQKARAMMSIWKQIMVQRLSGAAKGTAQAQFQVLVKTYASKRREWKSHDFLLGAVCPWMSLHSTQKFIPHVTRSCFFSTWLTRCHCTNIASPRCTSPSFVCLYLLPLVFAVLAVLIPTSCSTFFLTSPYSRDLLTYGCLHVIRTMIMTVHDPLLAGHHPSLIDVY